MTAIEVGGKMQSYLSIVAPEGASFGSYKSILKKSTTDLYVMHYRHEDDVELTLEGEVTKLRFSNSVFS